MGIVDRDDFISSWLNPKVDYKMNKEEMNMAYTTATTTVDINGMIRDNINTMMRDIHDRPKPCFQFANAKIIEVEFEAINNHKCDPKERTFRFFTTLNLQVGAKYIITTSEGLQYKQPVVVKAYCGCADAIVATITEAKLVSGPPVPDDCVENIWFNEWKGTTTIKWKDGITTTVHCDDWDDFDKEKGIALCYMKRFFDNRGCYNRVFDKYIKEELE